MTIFTEWKPKLYHRFRIKEKITTLLQYYCYKYLTLPGYLYMHHVGVKLYHRASCSSEVL